MPAQIHDKLLRVGKRGTKTTLANPGKPVGATSLTIDNPNNWETRTAIIFSIYRETADGKEEEGSYTVWKGVLNNSEITGLKLLQGTDQAYEPGGKTVAVMHISSSWVDELMDGLDLTFNADGTIKDKIVSLKSIHGGSTPGILQTDASGAVSASKNIALDKADVKKFGVTDKESFDTGYGLNMVFRKVGNIVFVHIGVIANIVRGKRSEIIPEKYRPLDDISLSLMAIANNAPISFAVFHLYPNGEIIHIGAEGKYEWYCNTAYIAKDAS